MASSAVTRGYRGVLHHVLDYKLAMVVLFFAGLGLTYFVFTRVPEGLRAGRRPGIFHRRHSGAVRGISGIHESDWETGFEAAERCVGSGGNVLGCGLQFFRQRAEPGNYLRSSQALFPAQGQGAYGVGNSEPGSSPSVWDFRSDRICHASSRRTRPGTIWRIPIRRAGPGFTHAAGTLRRNPRHNPGSRPRAKIWLACIRRLPRTIRSFL